MKYYYLFAGICPVKIYKTKVSALSLAKKINKTQGFRKFTLLTCDDFYTKPLKVEKFNVKDGEIFYE